MQLCRDMERQSLANLHIVGSKLGECLQTALYRLSDKREGDPKLGNAKYRYNSFYSTATSVRPLRVATATLVTHMC